MTTVYTRDDIIAERERIENERLVANLEVSLAIERQRAVEDKLGQLQLRCFRQGHQGRQHLGEQVGQTFYNCTDCGASWKE